jgi:hypothetical protein
MEIATFRNCPEDPEDYERILQRVDITWRSTWRSMKYNTVYIECVIV